MRDSFADAGHLIRSDLWLWDWVRRENRLLWRTFCSLLCHEWRRSLSYFFVDLLFVVIVIWCVFIMCNVMVQKRQIRRKKVYGIGMLDSVGAIRYLLQCMDTKNVHDHRDIAEIWSMIFALNMSCSYLEQFKCENVFISYLWISKQEMDLCIRSHRHEAILGCITK